jgi:hypothetical protein
MTLKNNEVEASFDPIGSEFALKGHNNQVPERKERAETARPKNPERRKRLRRTPATR